MELAVAFLIGLGISTGVLIVAMILTSKILGGIDFGELKTAALKAAGILIVVNLVAVFVPGGVWLALVVWFVGLMALFQLKFIEAFVLTLINWGLMLLVRVLLPF